MRRKHLLFVWLGVAAFGLVGCGDDDTGGPVCGNGIVEGDEVCDGDAFAGPVSCADEGFVGGTISCTDQCTVDISGCNNCGDGIKDDDEACDGTDFGTATCETEGHTGGELTCTASCTLDDSTCTDDTGCPDLSLTSMGAFCTHDGTNYIYQEFVSAGADTYVVDVELWPDYINGGAGGSLTLGDHPLGVGDEVNFANCAYCVLLYRCVDAQCSDVSTVFFATDGTLTLSSLGTTEGASFSGSLTGVTYTEWDGDNDVPVTDGECFVVDHTLDATVTLE